ncbi:hypothetical protein DXG01_014310 [Tephrocybe rancida]|nr:hypothetical protein DXG01_014310 [Tephrocybe rancida]
MEEDLSPPTYSTNPPNESTAVEAVAETSDGRETSSGAGAAAVGRLRPILEATLLGSEDDIDESDHEDIYEFGENREELFELTIARLREEGPYGLAAP